MPRHTRRTAAAAAAAEADAAGAASTNETAEPGAEPDTKRLKTAPEPIALGDAIPEGEVQNQDGTPVNLAEKYSSGVLALYAYPKASTPGCTRQTSGFGEAYSELASLGVTVFGISADLPASQATFKSKTGVDFDLLSDPEYTLLAPLGAKKSPKGVLRSHWVFVDGKALLVEHQVKPDASPGRVLDAVKEAISKKTDGTIVDAPETRIESDSASGKPETAKDLAAEPAQKLSDGADGEPDVEPKPEREQEQEPAELADAQKTEGQEPVEPQEPQEPQLKQANGADADADADETKTEADTKGAAAPAEVNGAESTTDGQAAA